ncbi:MAG TPA: phosphatidate cytidylyltransferase [Hyphomicrobiaceae bacterium]|nr:phosphatidate cytidylyltransferase [Hyphomicrobiaceae bacterium]
MTERIAAARSARLPSDLKLRIVSGLVLAGVALAADYVGPPSFAALVVVVAGLMCWEWGSVVRRSALDATHFMHAASVAAAAMLAAGGAYTPALSALALGCILVAMVRPAPAPWLSVLGVAYVGLPAVALIWIRNDEPFGALAVLFIFAVVWTTDTFAYVCGTLIGGPKLCPRLSPAKTWAGTIGGLLFAAAAGFVLAVLIGRPSPLTLSATAIFLSVCAQAGDLAESALKRAFDVKHASRLIPGHGGFLDRMDGIVVAASAAALAAMLVNVAEPARALLFWH